MIDLATVPAPSIVGGRTAVDPPRVRRYAPAAGHEEHGHDHALAIRPLYLGHRRTGLAEARWQDHVLRRREQQGLQAPGRDTALGLGQRAVVLSENARMFSGATHSCSRSLRTL